VRAVFHLKGKKQKLYFHDPRVFGRLWYIDPSTDINTIIPSIGKMGVEPLLDLQEEYLEKIFSAHKRSIKASLLDQNLIAGIGNIYADEALYVAGIHPLKSTRLITSTERKRLIVGIENTLKQAIRRGGSTLRNYTDSKGVNGSYQDQAWVYGRAGKLCRTCDTKIERVRVMARSTHFCPKCQKAKKSEIYVASLVRND
jgi:formamidopyrimidine-DNA glycosylase